MISLLRQYWQATPFVPFKIHLADGRTLLVPHPEYFFMSPKGGQIFVSRPDDDEVNLLNPLIIVSVARVEEHMPA